VLRASHIKALLANDLRFLLATGCPDDGLLLAAAGAELATNNREGARNGYVRCGEARRAEGERERRGAGLASRGGTGQAGGAGQGCAYRVRAGVGYIVALAHRTSGGGGPQGIGKGIAVRRTRCNVVPS